MTEAMERRRGRGRGALIAVLVVVAVVAALYLLRLGALAVSATEGDVPAVSAIPLPEGSTVVERREECASGGCWITVSVLPPAGTTPGELAAELGATPQARLPGTPWDPRTVSLRAEVRAELLVIQADLWSQEDVP